jgi:hypothetical protein
LIPADDARLQVAGYAQPARPGLRIRHRHRSSRRPWTAYDRGMSERPPVGHLGDGVGGSRTGVPSHQFLLR